FGAVVEGDGLAELGRHSGKQREELLGDGLGGLVGRPGGEDETGVALVDGEHRLAILGKEHEIGFPVAGGLAVGDGKWPFGNGNAALDEAGGTATAATTEATLALGAGQIKPPAVVLG